MNEGYKENRNTFSFYFNDNEGKRVDFEVTTSDGALGVVKEFEKFMKACGYIADGHLTIQRPVSTELGQKKIAPVAQADLKSKFDFSAIPNNNWLFGTQQIKALTTADIAALTVTTNPTVNQYPTMAPLTPENVQRISGLYDEKDVFKSPSYPFGSPNGA